MIAPATVPALGLLELSLLLPPLALLVPPELLTSTHVLWGAPTVAAGAGAEDRGTVMMGTEAMEAESSCGWPPTAMEEDTGTLVEVSHESSWRAAAAGSNPAA